ncbi:MAG: ShlB/FhaC/HecB family hemolysin secretion/activation protein [Verrucomicrobia bacterium]|nr:ShlB/FhaC/HecB family hemolysin secretion/activation protein [Verrucomicrobiota bacterium]
MNKKKILYLFSFFLSVIQLAATPPPVPSAGIVERELEKEYEGKPFEADKEIPAIQIDIPRETLDIPDGKKIFIHQIAIKGNESIATKEIVSWLKDYLDKDLSLREIYEICHVIDHHYAKKGYFLARAYPPPQTIENGELLLEVIEGKLGNIQVIGNKYYSESFIKSYFTSLQNKALRYEDFLHALMLLNENTDLMAGALFEKGEEFGCADLILRVNDARPLHLYLNGNNYGKNLTTNVRAGGRLDWGNVITQGDKISIAEVVGFPVDALYFTDVNYTVPLNRKGTSLEAAYLFSKFKIEELTSLHLKGRSDIATLKVNQALIRNRSLSIDLFSYFDYKQIQNFVLSHRTSFDKLRVLTVGALLDHFTPSQGRDYLNVQFSAGIPNFLGGLKPVDSESSRKGGGGRFFLLTADYDRIQHLPKDCFLYFHTSGQLSPSRLTLPEQIYIGGIDTVRGFPLAVALGDSGYYVNFEFRIPPPFLAEKRFFKLNKKWKDIVQFDAFLDQGGVFLQSESNTFLWGSGAGIRVNGPYNLALSVDVGFPLNHRKNNRGVFTYVKLTCQAF